MELPPQVKPWGFPDPLKPLRNQDKAAFKTFQLEHNAALDINSIRSPNLLLRIIATIGEATMDTDVLEQMIEYGMCAARFDFSVGAGKDHILNMRRLKVMTSEISAKMRMVIPIPIIADLKGPQVLTGKLAQVEKVQLKKGNTITLTAHPAWDDKGTAEKVFVDYKDFPYILKQGDKVFLDFGRIELYVRGTIDADVVCEILNDGELGEYKVVTALNVPFDLPTVTSKDRKDIAMLIEEKADAIFVSGVHNKCQVRDIKKVLGERGRGIMVFPKIESLVAYNNLDEILSVSDGLVIHRGMLGIENSTERVMLAQKSTVARAIKAGKPVFVLTEYLNSMIHMDCPTIAESTDVVTAVLDGVDGIIMMEETAKGDDPVRVVRTLMTLAREAESQVWQYELFKSLDALTWPPLDPAKAVCMSAVTAALKSQAAAILVVTTSGRSAQVMASYRPRCPVIAITRYGAVARQLNLFRGVYPIHYLATPDKCYSRDVDLRLQYGIEVGKIKSAVRAGDPLVLVNG